MNPHEQAGRRRKVLAMLARVPMVDSREKNELAAQFFEGLTVPNRATWATLCGVTAPSDETWRELVEAIRARAPIGEPPAWVSQPDTVRPHQRWRGRLFEYTIASVAGNCSDPHGETAMVVLDDGEERGPWLCSHILADDVLINDSPEVSK